MPATWQQAPQNDNTHFADLADGRWIVTQGAASALCTPARGNGYPYSLVAPMVHDELSFRAAKILAEDAAAWSVGVHGKDALETRPQMDGLHRFSILVDGLAFELIQEKSGWMLGFDLGDGRREVRGADCPKLADAIGFIAEVFDTEHAHPAIAARLPVFRVEIDRARAKSVLVEKLADGQEQAAGLQRTTLRGNVSKIVAVTQATRSAVKACEYALDNLRRADIRRYGNPLRSTRTTAPFAC